MIRDQSVGVIMLVPLWMPECEANSIYGPDNGTSVGENLVLNFPNVVHFNLAIHKHPTINQLIEKS